MYLLLSCQRTHLSRGDSRRGFAGPNSPWQNHESRAPFGCPAFKPLAYEIRAVYKSGTPMGPPPFAGIWFTIGRFRPMAMSVRIPCPPVMADGLCTRWRFLDIGLQFRVSVPVKLLLAGGRTASSRDYRGIHGAVNPQTGYLWQFASATLSKHGPKTVLRS